MTKPRIIINYPVGVPIHMAQILVNGIDVSMGKNVTKMKFTMETGSKPRVTLEFVDDFEGKIGQICGDKEKDLTG